MALCATDPEEFGDHEEAMPCRSLVPERRALDFRACLQKRQSSVTAPGHLGLS